MPAAKRYVRCEMKTDDIDRLNHEIHQLVDYLLEIRDTNGNAEIPLRNFQRYIELLKHDIPRARYALGYALGGRGINDFYWTPEQQQRIDRHTSAMARILKDSYDPKEDFLKIWGRST